MNEIQLPFTANSQGGSESHAVQVGESGDVPMVTVEDFSRLVSGVYAAAVTPQRWESAVADIQRALDGNTSALLIPEGPAARRYLATTLNIDARDSYAEYYCHLDYAIAAVDAGPVGAVRTWTELVEPKKNSEFYADWLRPRHFKDALFVRLSLNPWMGDFEQSLPVFGEA